MEPIVSPSLIYILSTYESLTITLDILFIILLLGTPMVFIGILAYNDCRDYDSDPVKVKPILKKMLIALGVVIFLCIVLPSRNTVIAMMIADHITVDNVNFVLDSVKKLLVK